MLGRLTAADEGGACASDSGLSQVALQGSRVSSCRLQTPVAGYVQGQCLVVQAYRPFCSGQQTGVCTRSRVPASSSRGWRSCLWVRHSCHPSPPLPFRVGEQESYSSGQASDSGARSEKMSVRKGALLGVSKVFVDTIFSERR